MALRKTNKNREVWVALTITGALLAGIPLALLAVSGRFALAVLLAAVVGPLLAWVHEHE